jgi:hypothetical protein
LFSFYQVKPFENKFIIWQSAINAGTKAVAPEGIPLLCRSLQARVNKTLGLKLLGFQHQISMQYFRLLLIVRLNFDGFMLVMHVMTVHVCLSHNV